METSQWREAIRMRSGNPLTRLTPKKGGGAIFCARGRGLFFFFRAGGVLRGYQA